MPTKNTKNTVLVAFNDFTDIDLFLLWDLLCRVEQPEWRVRIVSASPVIKSSTGIEIRTHGGLEEANDADAVLFTSGKGTRALIKDDAFLGAFRLDVNRQLIGAIDSGALLLGALGLLKGKRTTSYPSPDIKPQLEKFGATVVWESLVVEGNLATAAQCLSGQYLAGWVIERLLGDAEKTRVLSTVAPLDTLSVPA